MVSWLIDSFDANAKTYCVRFDDGDMKPSIPESSIQLIEGTSKKTDSVANPPSTNLHDDIQNEKSNHKINWKI